MMAIPCGRHEGRTLDEHLAEEDIAYVTWLAGMIRFPSKLILSNRIIKFHSEWNGFSEQYCCGKEHRPECPKRWTKNSAQKMMEEFLQNPDVVKNLDERLDKSKHGELRLFKQWFYFRANYPKMVEEARRLIRDRCQFCGKPVDTGSDTSFAYHKACKR